MSRLTTLDSWVQETISSPKVSFGFFVENGEIRSIFFNVPTYVNSKWSAPWEEDSMTYGQYFLAMSKLGGTYVN